jgi:hypothetical protein
VAGPEIVIFEDEAAPVELSGSSGTVLFAAVLCVMRPVLQAVVMAIDVISAPAAAIPVRFKNCRLENFATLKILRFLRGSFSWFSGIVNLPRIVTVHESSKQKKSFALSFHQTISRLFFGINLHLS